MVHIESPFVMTTTPSRHVGVESFAVRDGVGATRVPLALERENTRFFQALVAIGNNGMRLMLRPVVVDRKALWVEEELNGAKVRKDRKMGPRDELKPAT